MVGQEQRLEIALPNIKLLKKICEKGRCLEFPYMKTILENKNEDGYYQSFHFTHQDLAETAITPNPLVWCDKVIYCIQIRFDGDDNRPIIDAVNLILNYRCWQLETDNEDLDLGFPKEDELNVSSSDNKKADQSLFTEADSTIDLLTKQFEEPLKNFNVAIECIEMGFYNLA